MLPEAKELIKVGVVSVFSTLITGGLIGAGLYFLTGNILSSVLISFGGILFIGYLYNLYIIQRFNKHVATLEADVQKTEAAERYKQTVALECCYCGTINEVLLDFSTDITFKCIECEKENKVIYAFKTAQITEPASNLSVLDIIKTHNNTTN